MNAFFRKLLWLTERRSKEAELREELREIALRLSVGAGRLRVVRQLLTESVLLASVGGALGVLFAVWGMRFLTLLLANGQANFTRHAELNWHVMGVAAALSILTGVVFGLAPALQATRVDLMPARQPEARADGGPDFHLARDDGCGRTSLYGHSRIWNRSNSDSIARTSCCSSWTPARPDTRTRRLKPSTAICEDVSARSPACAARVSPKDRSSEERPHIISAFAVRRLMTPNRILAVGPPCRFQF